MTRWIGWGIGATTLGLAGLLAFGSPVGASDERRIEIVRGGQGRLGVVLEEVKSDDLARLKLTEERGAVVKEVQSGSPAEKAGLKAGDVILRYQAEPVQSVTHLGRLVRETPAGRKVALEVSRNGAVQKLSATVEQGDHRIVIGGGPAGHLEIPDLMEVPEPPEIPRLPRHLTEPGVHGWKFGPFARGPLKLGIQFQEVSGQLAQFFRLAEGRGVLVTEVEADSPAAKSGVKAGDAILKLNGKTIRDGDDLQQELGDLKPGAEATLTVQRDGKPLDLRVTLGGHAEKARGGEST